MRDKHSIGLGYDVTVVDWSNMETFTTDFGMLCARVNNRRASGHVTIQQPDGTQNHADYYPGQGWFWLS